MAPREHAVSGRQRAAGAGGTGQGRTRVVTRTDPTANGQFVVDPEILEVFSDETEAIFESIQTNLQALSDSPSDRKALWEIKKSAHTLKGAARGVGAFGLADIAAEAEKIPADRTAAIEVVHRLKGTSSAVHVFVEELLESPA